MNLKSTLKLIKLNESTISMILGAIVIIIVGILVVNYFRASDEGETIPSVNIEQLPPLTHKVESGEDLWSISEKYYQTGYNWVKIAQANDLTNPGQIEVGQELIIPDVTPKLTASSPSPTPRLVVMNSPEAGGEIHVVQKGESLWGIAERYYEDGYSWIQIAQENSVQAPYLIEEGDSLRIPVIATLENDDTKESISDDVYTVRPGDYLWEISERAYGDGYRWLEVAKANDLANPDVIHPGNVLTLPR